MKAVPMQCVNGGYEPCAKHVCTHVLLHLPGPFPDRMIPVYGGLSRPNGRGGPLWSWNEDTEKPTMHPSILTNNGDVGDVCHCWIKEGKVEFLSDCSHEFAGQTLDMLEVEY